MNYELSIKETNIPAHLDIEKEIAQRKNGQMTFTLRIDKGNISDMSVVEYVDVRQYLRPKTIIVEKFVVTSYTHGGDKPDAIRHSNG